MVRAGIHPAKIYTYRRKDLIVTEDNQHLLSEEDRREWDAALAEYEEKLRSGDAGPRL